MQALSERNVASQEPPLLKLAPSRRHEMQSVLAPAVRAWHVDSQAEICAAGQPFATTAVRSLSVLPLSPGSASGSAINGAWHKLSHKGCTASAPAFELPLQAVPANSSSAAISRRGSTCFMN